MELVTEKRDLKKVGGVNRLRREGKIPAVVYSRGEPGDNIALEYSDFAAILRAVQKGMLSTTVLTLKDSDGKERKVLVRDIQYHPTTYNVLHLDFEELHEDSPVNVRVPVEATGAVDCVGIKHGGVLRRVVRSLRVRCLPKDIPSCFTLDVSKLELKQSRRLNEIKIPEGVRPMQDLNEVALVITKR